MSKTFITTANADRQYSPATLSNDMLIFAGYADQQVVIGVGANVGQPNVLVPNYLAVGSNDTIIGNNLIVMGTIKDSTGAAYGGSSLSYTRFCTKYTQTIVQTIPTHIWTVVKNFTNAFMIGHGIAYSDDGFFTNVSDKTLTLSISYTLAMCGSIIQGGKLMTKLRVYHGNGSLLHQLAKEVCMVLPTVDDDNAMIYTNTILLQTPLSILAHDDTTLVTGTLLLPESTIQVQPPISADTFVLQDDRITTIDDGVIYTNTILLQTPLSIQAHDDTILVAGTLLLPESTPVTITSSGTFLFESLNDIETNKNDTTLSGSTFIQLQPAHKFALFGFARFTCNTKESTMCISELG
jgi:hypothetical protein